MAKGYPSVSTADSSPFRESRPSSVSTADSSYFREKSLRHCFKNDRQLLSREKSDFFRKTVDIFWKWCIIEMLNATFVVISVVNSTLSDSLV